MAENSWAPVELTDKIIKELPRPPNGKKPFVRDTRTEHLGIRLIRPETADEDAYALKYRVKGGPKIGTERYYTIGLARNWSLVAARNEAKRLNRLIDQGHDPAGEREHDRQAPTVNQLCERYLEEHVDIHNKPRTRAENRRMVERIIKPKLGSMKVEAVEHDDIAKLHRDLKATPRQANHVVAVLSKMFNLAEIWKDGSGKKLRLLNSNPARHLKRYPEAERDRYPRPEELERIGAALRDMVTEGKLLPEDAACIWFLAFVGCRLNEGVGLDLADVNFRTGEWTLGDAKAGDRTVMLGAPALALLASLERTTGRAFMRKGKNGKPDRPVTVNMIERAWIGDKAQPGHRKKPRPGIRDRAGVPDLRIHDLRHGVGTYAGMSGLNQFLVRDLLGHRTLAQTGKYVSRHASPLRAAADAVSGQIDAAMKRPPAEVVQLPKAGRS